MQTPSTRFLTRAFGAWALAGMLLGSSVWISSLLQPLGGSALWLQWVPLLCLVWLHHRRIVSAIARFCARMAPRPRRPVQARWI